MASVVGRCFGILILFLFCSKLSAGDSDSFHEELFIRNLQTGHVYTHFQFTTLWNQSLGADDAFTHFHLFPKAFGEVLHAYSVRELHLSLTQGSWRHESWGYPINDAATGAELWVWFMDKRINIDSAWTELINVLSGMFCTSLNFMDMKTTIVPKINFRPLGVTTDEYDRWFTKNVRYASLPRENICTENLTPWKKLLPCGVKAGLSTLLNALKLYDASYHSLGIHFRPVCIDSTCSATRVELSQTLSVVFDPAVAFGSLNGRSDWTMKKLFGRMITSSCPLATKSSVYVDLGNNTSEITLRPKPSYTSEVTRGKETVQYAVYNIPDYVSSGSVLNLDVKFKDQTSSSNVHPPAVTATRFQTGYGQATGGIACLIYNNHPTSDIVVSYLEVIPWFIRMYFHTLKVEYFTSFPMDVTRSGVALKPLQVHYHPGKDRQRPYHLELAVRLPSASVTRISFEFERQLLKWTEYPPDANHGFYIGSAVVGAILPDAHNVTSPPQSSSILASLLDPDSDTTEKGFFVRLYTVPLLVSLPTPDFSMPYNVICLACTVIAIAFGSIHNLTTRRFVLFDPNKHKGILTKIKDKIKDKGILSKIKDKIKNMFKKNKEHVKTTQEESSEMKSDDSDKTSEDVLLTYAAGQFKEELETEQ